MSRLAGHIEMTHRGVAIDGEPFPFLLADPESDPVKVRREAGIAVVYLPVLAESVSVDLRYPASSATRSPAHD